MPNTCGCLDSRVPLLARSHHSSKKALAQDFLRRFHARQRKEIENLNRSVEAAAQERDNGTEAMVANTLAR